MWKTIYGNYYGKYHVWTLSATKNHGKYFVENSLWKISRGEFYLGQQFTGVFSFSFFSGDSSWPGELVGIKQHLSVNDKMIRWWLNKKRKLSWLATPLTTGHRSRSSKKFLRMLPPATFLPSITSSCQNWSFLSPPRVINPEMVQNDQLRNGSEIVLAKACPSYHPPCDQPRNGPRHKKQNLWCVHCLTTNNGRNGRLKKFFLTF